MAPVFYFISPKIVAFPISFRLFTFQIEVSDRHSYCEAARRTMRALHDGTMTSKIAFECIYVINRWARMNLKRALRRSK